MKVIQRDTLSSFHNRRIAILYGDIHPDGPPDEKDVLIEVDFVASALKNLGYEPLKIPFSFNIIDMVKKLEAMKPLLVFNLVESLLGHGYMSHFPLLLLDYLKLPHTGSRADAIYTTTNKILCKKILSINGIYTPLWQILSEINSIGLTLNAPFILKKISEDASIGISDASIFYDDESLLQEIEKTPRFDRKDYFVEAFIEGREINVPLLSNNGCPEILPLSEIVFDEYPSEKPKIVGYDAKWHKDSFEYQHTFRIFDFNGNDKSILEYTKKTALRCWEIFDLKGYARVDFRIDNNGKPWILEVNANPCISPDSGFVSSAHKAGISSHEEIIQRIITDSARDTLKYGKNC